MKPASGGEHGQRGPTASRPTFKLIQILRAVAALMVVAHHATIMLWQRDHLPVATWINGASGVDLFFVISGFVMAISTAPLRSAAHPARTFFARRLERVVPMYWVVTTVKVVALLAVPALGVNALGGWRYVLSSYLFFPYLSPEHSPEPVVVVGWTLNFEMAFYLLLSVALALRLRPILLLAPVIAGVVAWRVLVAPFGPVPLLFFENSLPVEFLLGMLLGLALPALRRLPSAWGALLVVGGFCGLLASPLPIVSVWRGLWWGLPATAVVGGSLALESRWGAASPRWMLELGDASYSIYLVHTFALAAVGMLLHQSHRPWAGEIGVAMAGAIVLSTAAGELSYRMVELPITRWLKGRRRTAVPAVG